MSIPAYRAVWTQNVEYRYRGSVLSVWLCLADHANAAGYCFPSIPRIAGLCGIDDRSAQRAVRVLVSAEIVRVKRNAGKINGYYVPVIGGEEDA